MSHRYLDIAVTPSVVRAQTRAYGAAYAPGDAGAPDTIGRDEAEFIAERDSFYVASVSETGWPYVQHRGGPKGFLRVLDERTLAFADFRGNRQLLTVGNASADPRVALFLMDYPGRRRLKILGRATVVEASADAALAVQVTIPGTRARVERVVKIVVEAFDWNCPQHITPRYTLGEIEELAAPLRARIAELEAALAARGPRVDAAE